MLLATGRFDEAKSVLVTFAGAASGGMIPSRFDDYSNVAHFNSVDASLWFINAAFAYLKASGDRLTFQDQLLPAIISIINSYQHGTLFGIHADHDGLITAGDGSTQLTWMDAKYEGVAFTPRYGKPVEVNALWFNALMLLAQYLTDTESEDKQLLNTVRGRANIVRQSFCKIVLERVVGLAERLYPARRNFRRDASPEPDIRRVPAFLAVAAHPAKSGRGHR